MSVIAVFICFRLKGELDLAILYTFCGIWFILRYILDLSTDISCLIKQKCDYIVVKIMFCQVSKMF